MIYLGDDGFRRIGPIDDHWAEFEPLMLHFDLLIVRGPIATVTLAFDCGLCGLFVIILSQYRIINLRVQNL